MKIGAVFPQTEIGNDPLAIRDYAQAAEALGYDHLLAYDHVVGASTTHRPDWSGPYTSETPFHEIFVLFGYLAGLTRRIELVTGIVILPQRQTVLAAKQAAEVDVLSGGRLRLGVGLGWNWVEYEALNEDFHTRGARVAEQVALMRALWRDPVVSFRGRWHRIDEAGINPLPVRRSIPVWFGGYAEAVLKRAGQIGDGWFPLRAPDAEMAGAVERLRAYARDAGRDPQDIGIEAMIHTRDDQAGWVDRMEGWHKLGATYLCVDTMRAGYRSPQAHIDALRRVAEVLQVGA